MARNPKMVYCRNCNSPMAENAAVCPTCGAKNKKPFYKKWWFIVLAVLVVIALIQSIGSDSDKSDRDVVSKEGTPVVVQQAQNPVAVEATQLPVQPTESVPVVAVEPTKPAIQKYTIGEVVKVDDVQIVINEVKEAAGTQYFQPEEGKRFFVVDLTLENLGSEDFAVSSIMLFSLKDDTGQEYSLSFSGQAAIDGKSPDGTIIPGDKLRGQLVYEIPVNATGLTLIFEPSLWGSSSVRFDLGN